MASAKSEDYLIDEVIVEDSVGEHGTISLANERAYF